MKALSGQLDLGNKPLRRLPTLLLERSLDAGPIVKDQVGLDGELGLFAPVKRRQLGDSPGLQAVLAVNAERSDPEHGVEADLHAPKEAADQGHVVVQIILQVELGISRVQDSDADRHVVNVVYG